MADCKTIHEVYWEAIHVKRMLKQSHLGNVTPQEEKSPHKTDCVEEPRTSNIQTDQLELDTEDSTSTVGLENSPMSTNNPQVQTPSDEEQVVDIPHINSEIDCLWGSTISIGR